MKYIIVGRERSHFPSPNIRYRPVILSVQQKNCRKSSFDVARFEFHVKFCSWETDFKDNTADFKSVLLKYY